MPRATRLVVTLVVLLALAAGCKPERRWFLIAGQSNAAGASDQPTIPAPGKLLRAAYNWVELEDWIEDPWVHKAPHQQPHEWATSPWPKFAASIGKVGLITTAVGGNCLLPWSDTIGRWHPDHAGELYDRAISAWLQAGSPPVEAVLWLQGECDAARWVRDGWDAEDARDAYRDALEMLAEAFHADIGAPMIVAPISYRRCRWENVNCDPALFEPDHPYVLPIVEAQEQAIELHPLVLRGPDIHELRHRDDNIHIWDVNTEGLLWAWWVNQHKTY